MHLIEANLALRKPEESNAENYKLLKEFAQEKFEEGYSTGWSDAEMSLL